MDIKFFKSVPGMEAIVCCFCDKPNCDVLIQESAPGGNYALAHDPCLQEFMAEEGEVVVETEIPTNEP